MEIEQRDRKQKKGLIGGGESGEGINIIVGERQYPEFIKFSEQDLSNMVTYKTS